MCKKVLGFLFFTTVTLITIGILGLHFIYKPVSEGTIYLKNAKGEAEVLRETETSIPHVYASSE